MHRTVQESRKDRELTASPSVPFHVAVIAESFPRDSEIAIRNVVTGLAEAGHRVSVFAEVSAGVLPRSWDERTGGRVDIEYFPQRHMWDRGSRWRNRLALLGSGVRSALTHFPRSPALMLRSLNVKRYGHAARTFDVLFHAIPFVNGKREFDVIHAQFGPAGIVAMHLRDVGAISGKLVTSFRGHDINRLPRRKPADYYTALFREGDFFTTDTEAMRGKLVRLGCPRDRIEVLHSAVDLDAFPVLPRSRPPGSIRLLSVCRLVEAKGIAYALQALRLLADRNPEMPWSYEIVGDGPQRESLVALAASLRLSNVDFPGWKTQPELAATYSASDIFLMPSVITAEGDEESQGLALQEAQASGLPVVASEIGGVPEGLIDGVTGVLVPQRDPAAICLAIETLIQRSDKWPEMGRRGRQFVAQEFSLDGQTAKLEAIYRRVCAG